MTLGRGGGIGMNASRGTATISTPSYSTNELEK